MDAGSLNSFSNLKGQSRCPLQEQLLQRRNSKENMDRFIPNRSAMDFDYAHYMLTEGRKIKENQTVCSPAREAYRKQLAETLNMNRTRILAFKNKPPTPVELFPSEHSTSVHPTKSWLMLLRTLKGCHRSRVGSMAWNNHILTTGGMEGQIVNNDVRIRSHVVETYRGHQQEVCGLKWSASGQ